MQIVVYFVVHGVFFVCCIKTNILQERNLSPRGYLWINKWHWRIRYKNIIFECEENVFNGNLHVCGRVDFGPELVSTCKVVNINNDYKFTWIYMFKMTARTWFRMTMTCKICHWRLQNTTENSRQATKAPVDVCSGHKWEHFQPIKVVLWFRSIHEQSPLLRWFSNIVGRLLKRGRIKMSLVHITNFWKITFWILRWSFVLWKFIIPCITARTP